ncbi:hypothetical protein PTNB73_05023 [Pyrenophora teres f. teres]|nr:hypothetical protein HRS9122_03238 [Pyrenophora teres f. teres]KAE8866929.1 hypothetical protein PTNB73_05023 [Pyrenophora teres f. teres]
MKPQALLACGTVALAQQVYIPAEGPSPRPKCSGNCTYATAVPQYTFREFSFTQTETVRTASSIPAPTATTTYAPPYASLSSLVPDLTTTQWVPTSELILPPPEYNVPETCYYFPKDFMLGVAAAAVQIEGAIADEGRAPVHNDVAGLASGAQNVGNLVTADSAPNSIAIENYYLFKQDIERIAAMGVKYYRFSIPWTRILPFILPGTPVNKQGLAHYEELIDFVLEKGMQPAIMLYHNDAPFQFYGGNLTNLFIAPGTGGIGYLDSCFQCSYKNVSFEDGFVNYGKIVMTHFADRVPIWWTFNEPILASRNGRSINAVIKAHARLSHFYHDEIKGAGKISLTFNDNFGVPRNPQDPADIDAANHFNSFQLATFANPIFLGTDYPESFKSSIDDHVPLSAEDLAYINGTADFFSIQPYTATVISPPPNGSIADCAADKTHRLRPYCVTQSTMTTTGWNIGYRSQSYVYTTPNYFRTFLNYLWNTWKSPVVVTEFGVPVFAEQQKLQKDQEFDSPRSQYYQSYLNEGLKAIWEDGVQFMGAFAWSWADNWEFGDYAQKFGIQSVNRTTMERRYKKSFFDFVDFIESKRQKA